MAPVISFDPVAATAVLLASVRIFAWMTVVPPFSGRYIPRAARAGAALAVGLAVGPRLRLAEVPGWRELVVDVGAQVLVGVGFGLITSFLVRAIASAGDTLDLFGGLALPQALEPIGFRTATSVGQLYAVATLALLVVTGGDLLLLRGLVTTFAVVGPTLGSLAPMAQGALQAVATMFSATFEIAGPLLAVEFLVQVALGLVAKAAPNVNIFLFAFSVQVFVLVMLLALGTAVLPAALHRLIDAALTLEGSLL